jgi:hypothetical protein
MYKVIITKSDYDLTTRMNKAAEQGYRLLEMKVSDGTMYVVMSKQAIPLN